jgi:hypothetical protein
VCSEDSAASRSQPEPCAGRHRIGTGILIGLAGLAIAALALIPFLGYLEAVALPALAARARRREPERYAGLRTLARD